MDFNSYEIDRILINWNPRMLLPGLPLLPTTIVGSYPQPDWLIHRDRLGAKVPLAASLPILENMGLEAMEEESWEIERGDGPPVFVEQGREYDKLVREDGVWKFSRRVVIADSGLPGLTICNRRLQGSRILKPVQSSAEPRRRLNAAR